MPLNVFMVISSAINSMIFLIYETECLCTFSTLNGIILWRLNPSQDVANEKLFFSLRWTESNNRKVTALTNHIWSLRFQFYFYFLCIHSIYATCKMQSMENYCFTLFSNLLPFHAAITVLCSVINEKFPSSWLQWMEQEENQ